MLPEKNALRGGHCHDSKQSRHQLTALLCANMVSSDKHVSTVIGKSAKPRSFEGNPRLPVKYVTNSNVRVTVNFQSGQGILTTTWVGKDAACVSWELYGHGCEANER